MLALKVARKKWHQFEGLTRIRRLPPLLRSGPVISLYAVAKYVALGWGSEAYGDPISELILPNT